MGFKMRQKQCMRMDVCHALMLLSYALTDIRTRIIYLSCCVLNQSDRCEHGDICRDQTNLRPLMQNNAVVRSVDTVRPGPVICFRPEASFAAEGGRRQVIVSLVHESSNKAARALSCMRCKASTCVRDMLVLRCLHVSVSVRCVGGGGKFA